MTDTSHAPQTILVAGAGACAVEPLRALIGSGAHLRVFGPNPAPQIIAWAEAGRLSHIPRPLTFSDVSRADRIIAATGTAAQDTAVLAIAARADSFRHNRLVQEAILANAPQAISALAFKEAR